MAYDISITKVDYRGFKSKIISDYRAKIYDTELLEQICLCYGTLLGNNLILMHNEYYEDGGCCDWNLGHTIEKVFKLDDDIVSILREFSEELPSYKEEYEVFEELGLEFNEEEEDETDEEDEDSEEDYEENEDTEELEENEREELRGSVDATKSNNDIKTKFLLAVMQSPNPIVLINFPSTDKYRLGDVLNDGFTMIVTNRVMGFEYSLRFYFSDYNISWKFA